MAATTPDQRVCIRCKERPRKPGQRVCTECHADYVREWRAEHRQVTLSSREYDLIMTLRRINLLLTRVNRTR